MDKFSLAIEKPTRVSKSFATLIDHIWTNDTQNYQNSGIFHFSLSDLFLVYSSFDIPNTASCSDAKIIKRKITDESMIRFKTGIINYGWDSVLSGLDIDEFNK